MKRGWRRWVLRVVGGLVLLWLVLSTALFAAMHLPPDRFGSVVAALPGPKLLYFALLPFQSLWNVARDGTLAVGDPAPDFDLERVEAHDAVVDAGSSRARLSSSFGREPVVLVFGSFT